MSDSPEVTTATTTDPTTTDPITTKLGSLGLNEDQITKIKALGAETVDDLSALSANDLVAVGIPVLKARKIVSSLAPATAATPPPAMSMPAVNFDTILPQVPDDGSWLNSLRAGGVLKIEQSTVISAIRAALADRFGLYDIPKRLVEAIETYIDVTEEQVTEEFWALRKQLTRRSYGDLFAAIDGLDGTFMTEKRKTELLTRINDNLWPSVIGFNTALNNWQNAWMQGSANPGMMVTAIMALAGGGGGVGMPPGIMQPPDCGVLRDAAEDVVDSLNRIFRGTGVQVAAALAYEANQIKSMIENPRMPILCGAPSRDILLKQLGVAVPATYPRMETNLSRFVLGIMQSDKIAAGNEELQYFGTLYMLGTQIPWEDLRRGSKLERPRGIGETTKKVVRDAQELWVKQKDKDGKWTSGKADWLSAGKSDDSSR